MSPGQVEWIERIERMERIWRAGGALAATAAGGRHLAPWEYVRGLVARRRTVVGREQVLGFSAFQKTWRSAEAQ